MTKCVSRKSLEIYSKIAITDAQQEYNEVINKEYMVHSMMETARILKVQAL